MEPKEGYVVYGKYQGNEYKVWFEDLNEAILYSNKEPGFIAIYQIDKIAE